MSVIQSIDALEILDSRGRPTVKAYITLKNGLHAAASVPSGASTGSFEAVELRDEDLDRYNGLGCKKAVSHIRGEIARAIIGKNFAHQFEFDQFLIDLDGSPQKSRLGANAILALSIAFAKVEAIQTQTPLYKYFASLINHTINGLPRLTVNLFSGGLHAGGIIPVQDSLIVPIFTKTVEESLVVVQKVYQTAAKLIKQKYNMRLLTADEGGLSPDFTSADEMFDLTVEAINQAGYTPKEEVSMAIDVASSHFYKENAYWIDEKALSSHEMIDILTKWQKNYPIISIEDGLAEEDWENWSILSERLGPKCMIMGDDLLCTNLKRIQKAIKFKAANALLLKVNQIGTLFEAAQALNIARAHDWKITASARSGETEDNWLADLAVGWGADYIKIGSITQSERLAKYNRLLEIEKTIT